MRLPPPPKLSSLVPRGLRRRANGPPEGTQAAECASASRPGARGSRASGDSAATAPAGGAAAAPVAQRGTARESGRGSTGSAQRATARESGRGSTGSAPRATARESGRGSRAQSECTRAAATTDAGTTNSRAVPPPGTPQQRLSTAVDVANRREDRAFRRGVRDIFLYVCFLALFTVVIQSNDVSAGFPYSDRMRERVLGDGDGSFAEIVTLEDVWGYLSGQLLEALYTNNEGDAFDTSGDRQGYVLEVNKLIGALRLEQSRVRAPSSGCSVPPVYQDGNTVIDVCYPSLRDGGYSDCPFGGSCEAAVAPDPDSSDCETPPCSDSFVWQGVEGGPRVFRGPVFVQDLPTNMTLDAASAWLTELQDRRWIDLQTREVRALFTTYNPAVDLFCSVEIIMAPRESGGVDLEDNFRTFNTLRHMLLLTKARDWFPPSAVDWVILVVELILYTLTLFMWVQVMRRLFRTFPAFFRSGWNVLDLVNTCCFVAIIALRIFIVVLLKDQNFDPPPNQYSDFVDAARSMHTVQDIMSVACVLSYFKLLRYFQLSPRLSRLMMTVVNAAPDLGGFLLIFGVVFCAFALAFYLAFGMDLAEFSTFWVSVYSLFLIILGDFDFVSLRQASPVLGPLLFFSFVIFVFFVLVNMFLAILGEAYERVSKRTLTQPDLFVRRMRAGWKKRLALLRRRQRLHYPTGQEAINTLDGEDDIQSIAPQPAGRAPSEIEATGSLLSYACSAETDLASSIATAPAGTLLRSLELSPDGEGEATLPLGAGGVVLGMDVAAVDTLSKRVAKMEEENLRTLAWLHASHRGTQDKLLALFEATAAISAAQDGGGGSFAERATARSSAAQRSAARRGEPSAARSTCTNGNHASHNEGERARRAHLAEDALFSALASTTAEPNNG